MTERGKSADRGQTPAWILACGAILVLAIVIACAVFAVLFFQSSRGGRPALACAGLAGIVLVWAFRVGLAEYRSRTRDSSASATADGGGRNR